VGRLRSLLPCRVLPCGSVGADGISRLFRHRAAGVSPARCGRRGGEAPRWAAPVGTVSVEGGPPHPSGPPAAVGLELPYPGPGVQQPHGYAGRGALRWEDSYRRRAGDGRAPRCGGGRRRLGTDRADVSELCQRCLAVRCLARGCFGWLGNCS